MGCFSRRALKAPNARCSIRQASLDQGFPVNSSRKGCLQTDAQHGLAEWMRHLHCDHAFRTSTATHYRSDGLRSRSVAHHSKHDRRHILTSNSKSGPSQQPCKDIFRALTSIATRASRRTIAECSGSAPCVSDNMIRLGRWIYAVCATCARLHDLPT